MNKQYFSVLLLMFIFVIASCSDSAPKDETETTQKVPSEEENMQEPKKKDPNVKYAHCWEGKLGGKIPVFFHYTIKDSILSGEVTYLNTKTRKPIRILGEISPNNYYRILEFNKKGKITGIWSLKIQGNTCSGTWYEPAETVWDDSKVYKEFKVLASPSDSIIEEWNLEADPKKVFGDYAYSFTEENGNSGGFYLRKKNANKALFEISSVTSAPAYNIASIEETEVAFSNQTAFDFDIPEYETCNFRVTFYKDFAYVRYTNGYCTDGYFGHNATVEGLFLKTK